MQGVFDHLPLVDGDIRLPGYASPYAILPRFSFPRFWLLLRPCLTSQQTMNHANLAHRGIVF